MDFIIWARITDVGPHQFLVVITALGELPEDADVRSVIEDSLEHARATRNRMARELGAELVDLGHRVVDVKTE